MSESDAFVFLARRPVPELGIQPGEVVSVRPGHARAVVVSRTLPANYGLILLAEEAGALEYVTPNQSLDRLRQAVGRHHTAPRRPRPRRRGRHLELCR